MQKNCKRLSLQIQVFVLMLTLRATPCLSRQKYLLPFHMALWQYSYLDHKLASLADSNCLISRDRYRCWASCAARGSCRAFSAERCLVLEALGPKTLSAAGRPNGELWQSELRPPFPLVCLAVFSIPWVIFHPIPRHT